MKKISLVLAFSLITLLAFSQQYAIEANLKSDLRVEDGVRIEVFENSMQIASVNTDVDGKAFVRFNGYFAGNDRSLVIHKPGFKRYVIEVKSIKKDVRFDLEMKAYSTEEENLMERVVANLEKVDNKFATLFFLLEESGSLKSITFTEFSANRSMSKMLRPLVSPDLKAAAEKSAKETEIKKAVYEQEKATQAAKETANEAEHDAEKAEKSRDKWDKDLKSFQKDQANLGDQRERLRRQQRKLDKKRNKIAPKKAESMQESITRDQRKLDKRQGKHDNALKKHMKDQPK